MHPKEIRRLVKECIVEVLQENLSEAFDPTSQGPNQVEENPYPSWNSKMRTMEETDDHGRYAQQSSAGQFDPRSFAVNEGHDVIYKDRQGGQWVYWMDNSDTGGHITIKPENVAKYIRQGYHIVELERDPRRQPDPDMSNYMGDGDRS